MDILFLSINIQEEMEGQKVKQNKQNRTHTHRTKRKNGSEVGRGRKSEQSSGYQLICVSVWRCGTHVPQDDGQRTKKTTMNTKNENLSILPFSGAKWSIIQCIVYRSNKKQQHLKFIHK